MKLDAFPWSHVRDRDSVLPTLPLSAHTPFPAVLMPWSGLSRQVLERWEEAYWFVRHSAPSLGNQQVGRGVLIGGLRGGPAVGEMTRHTLSTPTKYYSKWRLFPQRLLEECRKLATC